VPIIVEFIERGKFDLLVIGYMGHSAIYSRLIGSTTDRLVELAPCHVLVVKYVSEGDATMAAESHARSTYKDIVKLHNSWAH
jgi:hypothetical protein